MFITSRENRKKSTGTTGRGRSCIRIESVATAMPNTIMDFIVCADVLGSISMKNAKNSACRL